ncbi:ABC-2 family transporter protein [Candidatus Dojkabacteria bacterium]|nr:ABC-2 family transporter protein [Candidatus Dojkabacteria bacterium]
MYWYYFKAQLAVDLERRLDFILDPLLRTIGLLVYFYLWRGSVSDVGSLFVYFLIYYLVVNPLHSGKVAVFMSKGINTGELNNFLCKPIDFRIASTVRFFSTLIKRLVLPTCLIAVAIIFLPGIFAPVSFTAFILFILALILGEISWILFMWIFGALSFWVTEIDFTIVVWDLIMNIFAGVYIPYFLFPESLKTILAYTPIPYWGAFPITIFQGEVVGNKVFWGFVILLGWTVVLYLTGKVLYRLGLKKYEGVGI